MNVSLLRQAQLEATVLHRIVRAWIPLFLLLWVVALRLQEPSFARRSAIPFFWAGIETALLLLLGVLPVVWVLGRRREASDWTLRVSRSSSRLVLGCWLGVVAYGLAVALLTILIGLGLDLALTGPVPFAKPGIVFLECALLLAPFAALAPAVSYLGLAPHLAILVWLLLFGASLARGFPVPTGSLLALETDDVGRNTLGSSAYLSAAQATLAGLLLSISLAERRMRP